MNSEELKAESLMEPAPFRKIVRNVQEDFNPFTSDNQSGTVFIRVSIPELKVQKCLQFELDESVWQAKQRILFSFSKKLKDSLNYGLYMPPMNGRAGKFLDEERLLREYPLQGPIGFLEFKHKRRVYKLIHLNPRKLRQLHTKSNLKYFMENVKSGNTSKINKMTNKGIDPNFQEAGTGETPLTLVTTLDNQKSREIIISLVSGGAHLDFRTKQGLTAIHKAVLADNLTALKTLLDLGASTNYKDAHGLTPLYYSVMYQKSAVITETLLFERAFLGIHDEQGWQEVHQACRHGLVQHLEHLIFYGVDMNVVTKTGNTPLHICAENNMENCARVLLFRGASKEILNFSNQSAQQTAIIAGNLELAELIKNHKSEDVVPFKEMPSFSDRRGKSFVFSSNFSVLSRSRSDPKLNFAGLDMDMKDQQAQTVPTRAFKGPSHRFHANIDYGSYPASQSSDSPKSLSISSTSSGPGLHGFRRSYCNPSRHVEMLFIPTDLSSSSSSDYTHMSHDFCLYKSSVGSQSSFSSLRSAHPSHTQLDVSSLSSAKSCISADVRYQGLTRDRVYVCVNSFTPQYPNDLEMKAGEIVEVLSSGDGDYWEGSVNERYGYFPADHVQEVRLRRKAGSMEDLLGESRETRMMNRNTLAALVTSDSEHSPRTVVLQKGSEGFGFVLRGAKSQLKPSGELDFRPTNEFPALQYLDNVDAGSPSDKAGLKPGDFILEINGENVVRASHDRVVNLIRSSGNTLAMKVVTVRPTGRSQDWFVHQNHSKTMPNRKKKAPEPPRRDPQTSLSYSRAEGQNISEEMKAMEKFDNAISGERKDSTTSTEQKTASIRGRHAVKRVSCIDTENLEVDQQKSNHISPSEARINKYHKGQNGALERSRSNPDLSGKPVYATPQVPNSANSSSGLNGTRVYDLPHGGQQSQPSPTNSRPNIAPPQPPSPVSNKSQRKQAPSPPTGEADKSEVVSITTNRKSQYVSVPHPGKPIEGSQFESSFRPGTSAKLTEEPTATVPSLEQSKLKPGHTRSSSTGAGLLKMVTVPLSNTPKEDSMEKRILAEDKVRESAADVMKSYPSAQLLVTADVHNSITDKKNSKPHEPEPDYDIDSGDEKKNFEPKAQVSAENNHKVTLISVGVESKTKPAPGRNRYTIHSTIPLKNQEESIEIQDVFIPPRPTGPAPIPPKNEERTWVGSRRSSFQSESSQPNSGNSSPRDMGVRMQKEVLAPPPPPPPPTAPPPPPVTPSPKSEIRIGQVREMNADKPALPTEDILAAVAKRKERLEVDGPRITMHKPEVKPNPRDRTQLAILEAVAKRRTALQHQSETAVVDTIETQLQKTKKLQAAKFSLSMNQRSNPSSETNVKVNTNDNRKSFEVTDKMQSKPNFLPVNSKPTRTEEKSKQPVKADIKSSHPTTKPVELSIKIGAKSSGDSLPSMTELKPKILHKSDSTKTKNETPLQKPDIKKEATKTNSEVQNVGKHEEKTHDTEIQLRPKRSDETVQNGDDKSNRNSDFVQLAEIKRQEWLQRKASQYNKSNSSSKQTSPDTSKPGSPDRSWKKGLIQIKPVSDKLIGSTVIMKDATTDQSNTDTKVKGQTLNGDVNHNDRNKQSKNVNSVKSPPSAFRDRKEVNAFVQLEIIPPPSSFLSESSTDIHDINNHHSNGPSFSPDSASIVSSLSTLSSLSGDHNDTNPHGYEDMIAPPPPGFDDGTNSADNIDQVARVIPPPPEFGNGYSPDKSARPFASKPVESWLCNDVLDWLDSLNMGQYKRSFQQNSIDGKNLVSFTRNNYIELGVTQVGHRMNLERSIKKLAMHQSHSNIIESERL